MTMPVRTRVPALEDLIHPISVACKYNILEKEHHESECTMFEKPLRLSLIRNHIISCYSDQFEKFKFDHNIDVTMNTIDRYYFTGFWRRRPFLDELWEEQHLGYVLSHTSHSVHTIWRGIFRQNGCHHRNFRMVTRCTFPTAEVDKGNTNFVVISSDEDVSIAVKVYQTWCMEPPKQLKVWATTTERSLRTG
jgi:hypothetical protein